MSEPRPPRLALRLAAEFSVIVIGVLVALAFDGLREEWQERQWLDDAVADIAYELRDQQFTFGRITMANLPDKIASLERIIGFLEVEGAPVQDTLVLLNDLVESAGRIRIWLRSDRYDALVSSGEIRLLRNEGDLIAQMAGVYNGPNVLLPAVEELQNDWSPTILQLIPAAHATVNTPLSGYNFGGRPLPYMPASREPALDRLVEELRARRVELLGLAQGELVVTLSNYNVLERLRSDFNELLRDLEPWLDEPLGDDFELGRNYGRSGFTPDFRSDGEIPRSELGASYAEGRYSGVAQLAN